MVLLEPRLNYQILHGLADDVREVVFGDLARRPDEQALLLHRAIHQSLYILLTVAELPDAAWGAHVLHQLDQYLRQRVLVGLLYSIPGEQLGYAPVPLGVRGVGEPEGGRGGDDDGPAVRDEGVVFGVAGRLPFVLEAGYGVGAGVRDVDPRRAEAYARERGPEHHGAAGLYVLAVLYGSPEVLAAVLERLRRPYVRNRVRPLVGRPVVRALRLGARVVGPRDVGLGGVANHVEPARGGHLRRHRHREEGVDDPAVAAQVLVRDPRLHPLFGDVKDGDRRRLGAGPGCGRDRDQGLQRRGRLLASADRRVDVVHDLAAVRSDEV